jgi:hypothetical protein
MTNRDYKNAGRARGKSSRRIPDRKAPRKGIPWWGWIVFGIAIGGGLAVATPLRHLFGDTLGRLNAVLAPVSDKSAPRRDAVVLDPPDESAPQFEFYEILPEMEVVIPPEELETVDQRQTDYQYRLQVGSFASWVDADELKARCALLGVEAVIVPVRIEGREWYRVQIGPFERARDTDIARRRLFDNDIDSIVLREERGTQAPAD